MTSSRMILASTVALIALVAPASAFDLHVWDGLLSKYVDSTGLVNYHDWKAQDEATLDRFLATIAATNPDAFTIPQERLAFWINAYNATVIKGILRRYPLHSVMDDPTFFKEATTTIGGKKLSLDQIENERIRPVFKDPRVHFALVCGARSCPRLLNRAYTAQDVGGQLDTQGREFLADPSKNRFDLASDTVQVSSIFQWFAGDFTGAAGSVVGFLKRYAPASAQPLLNRPGVRIQYLPYDWSLNEIPSAGSGAGSGAGSRSSN